MTRAQWRRSFLLAKLLTLAVAACSSAPASPGGSAAATSGLTYYRDVKPIVDAKCIACHTAGGIAPFALTGADDVLLHKDAIAFATASRTMPPWPPGKGCTDYVGDRSLSDAQIATIGDWVKSGATQGDPADFAPLSNAGAIGMTRVDRTLTMPDAYTPKTRPDDYRCFLLDWTDTTAMFVTGFGARPGHASIVHHVLAYAVDPAQVPTFQQYDADDPGPGYTCFGGPSAAGGSASTAPVREIGGWAPGSTGNDFPAGTGIRIEAGSKIVMQVHYNTLNADPTPDQTGLALAVADHVDKEAFIVPWTDPAWIKQKTMTIAAGNPSAAHAFTYDALGGFAIATKGALKSDQPVTVHSATLHMHLLGTTATLTTQHAQAGEDECLLSIPHWNFHWQGSYAFANAKQIRPGDKLHLECQWDNSQRNQPVVDGVQLEPPRDVNWGEGSTDEMCLGFLYVTQ